SPAKAAKNFTNAIGVGDLKTAYKYGAPDMGDVFKAQLKKEGKTNKEFYEELGKELDAKIKNLNQYYNYMKKEAQKELKDEYGSNYKVTTKVLSSEKLSNKERDDLLDGCEYFIKQGLKISDPDSILKLSKIKKVYKVEVEVTIKGKKGSETETGTLYVAKVSGKWKVIWIASGFGV
ncbi:MAG: hypothetical protein FWE85_05385, partial [Clostridiales bacterium]|nr:hypothetical protein [Clostridiales bacterium]